jgi:hypothetical protein
MVRNLGILKIELSLPTRFDQCNAGPLDVSLTAIAIKINRIENKIKITTAKNRSKNRFIEFNYVIEGFIII